MPQTPLRPSVHEASSEPAGRTRTSPRLIAGAAGVMAAFMLSACSYLSPPTVNNPYPPSDGVLGELIVTQTGAMVKLRNMLVVGTTPDGPGQVIGSLINEGDSAVTVVLSAAGAAGASAGTKNVVVPAHGVAALGSSSSTRMNLPSVPGGPGALLPMTASTSGAGTTTLSVPIVEAVGPYATLAPRVTATPTETATDTPSESSAATESGTGDSPEATATATDS